MSENIKSYRLQRIDILQKEIKFFENQKFNPFKIVNYFKNRKVIKEIIKELQGYIEDYKLMTDNEYFEHEKLIFKNINNRRG